MCSIVIIQSFRYVFVECCLGIKFKSTILRSHLFVSARIKQRRHLTPLQTVWDLCYLVHGIREHYLDHSVP